VRFGSAQYRLLYFFWAKKVIITHGFVKRTDEVAESEIEKALIAMEDFLKGIDKGDVLL
jgi:phage-related protein